MSPDLSPAPLLEVRDITVSFDGFKAIQNLSLKVQAGSLRVLIGPNGAGKSTLLDTVIGKVQPASGEVLFEGERITGLPEHQVARRGICRKFQAPGVLEGLSVRDNLRLAVRGDKNVFASFSPKRKADEEARVDELLHLIGLLERQHIRAGDLAHGEKQWLEIGMVVSTRPKLLLLDEPTAGMTAQETAQTAALIHSLAGEHAVLVIDHDMHFVELLAAPITVLHQGRIFREGDLESIRNDPEVMEIYLGRPKDAAD